MEPLISTNASLLPESQATQIVREALRGGVSTPKTVTLDEPEVYVEENLTSSDIKSTPHYHYHGLAVTQSPTQPNGRCDEDSQGSQETSHSYTTGPGQNAASSDRLAPPLSPKSPSHTNEPPGTPPPSKAGKTTSFLSPHRPPVTPLRKSKSLHAPARRSPSPQSQDSFAGSIPVNPEAAFLAKSKRFGLPLSQLENSLEQDSMFSPISSKPNPGPSPIVGMSQSSSDGTNSQNTQPVPPAQEASQPETTQYLQDTNYMEYLTCISNNRNPYIDRSGANFPQSPDSSSSSSGNFPENDSHPYEEPTQIDESTQPGSDMVPTQPSTQVARETAEVPTQTDASPADAPSEIVSPPVISYQTPLASTAASSTGKRSLFNQLKKWRQIPGIPHPHGLPANRRDSTSVVPETPLHTDSTGFPSTGQGGVQTTPSAPELPVADPLLLDSHSPVRSPIRSPILSLQSMPPPPNPPRVDEDETMDIIPDSEPSRMADVSMSSLHRPGLASRMPPFREDDDEIVPESSGEADDKSPPQTDPDRIPQVEKAQETEPEGEQDDDPMGDDQPLVRQQARRPPKPVVEEEEEEGQQAEQGVCDDTTVPETEDEVPLATIVKAAKPAPKPLPQRGRSTRNKRPIVYTESPDTSENEEEEETPIERPAKKRKVEKVEKVQAVATPVATRGRGGRKAKQPASAKAVKSPAKGSVTKARPQKGRGKGKKASAEASAVTSGRHSPPAQDDEAKTEPAEEDEEEAGFKSSDDMPRKRRRSGLDQKPHKTASGTSTPQGITPQRGGSKRVRSLPGSLRDIAHSDGTRVFARWPLCKHFYAGIVHSRSPFQSDLYVVRFGDDTECPVHISDLRQSELEEGDEVFVTGYNQSGRVTAIDRWDSEQYVRVQVDTGGELDVKANSIKIHESVIDKHWGDRLVHESSICTSLQAQGLNSSTSKSTAVNGTSTSKFLKRIGFVVTMKSQSPDDKHRTDIFDLIKDNGGKVIDDWATLFPFPSTLTERSWVARRADVRLKGPAIQTVFLLADEWNQKPKYLVALALGIPCVSTRWLLDCRKNRALIDWNDYLLAAGEYSHGLMSQRVNLRWGDKSQRLHDIYRDMHGSNSTLLGKSVLCIGLELFPPGKPKNLKRINSEDDKQNESTRKLPSIMLAMGADEVEAVCDLKHALREVTDYDLVLVKDVEEVEKFNAAGKVGRPPCVHIPWVKECLVAGRLLDIPEV